MVKDYSESLLEARKAMDCAETLLRLGRDAAAKEEMLKVIVSCREVVAWVTHNQDMEHMKNGN